MIQFKKGNMGIFALDWIEDGGVQRAREGGWGGWGRKLFNEV